MNKRVNTSAFAATGTDTSAFAAVQVAALPAGQETGVWIRILPAGQFTGRDGRGPFEVGDKTAMQAIIDRSLRFAGGTELMLDYDHQSYFAAIPGVGGTAKAAGWFKELQARDDGIYGRVEWTAAAAEAIKAGEYRYISPLFSSDKAGKVIRIQNAALVNQPNLDLVAVAAAASRFSTKETEDMELLAKLAKALGLADGVSEDAVVAAATSLTADRGKMITAAGLKPEATADQVVTAMGAALAAKKPDPTEFVPMTMFTDVRDRLTTLQASTAADKTTEAVAEAMKAGKITPAQKDWATDYHTKDAVGFAAFVANQPALTAQQMIKPKPADGSPVLDDTDTAVMTAMGISADKFAAARKKEVN
jgi:phage I-like protein